MSSPHPSSLTHTHPFPPQKPTVGPTPAPTQFPTTRPPPPGPNSPVLEYTGPTRCGPQVALFGQDVFTNGRLLEEEEDEKKPQSMVPKEAATHLMTTGEQLRRELQDAQTDVELCYDGE